MGVFDKLPGLGGGGAADGAAQSGDSSADDGEATGEDRPADLSPSEFRERAEALAGRSDVPTLDFTVESLDALDGLAGGPPTPVDDELVYGSYLGETLVRAFDAEWTRTDGWQVAVELPDDRTTVAVFDAAAMSIADEPVFARVAEQLEANGAATTASTDDSDGETADDAAADRADDAGERADGDAIDEPDEVDADEIAEHDDVDAPAGTDDVEPATGSIASADDDAADDPSPEMADDGDDVEEPADDEEMPFAPGGDASEDAGRDPAAPETPARKSVNDRIATEDVAESPTHRTDHVDEGDAGESTSNVSTGGDEERTDGEHAPTEHGESVTDAPGPDDGPVADDAVDDDEQPASADEPESEAESVPPETPDAAEVSAGDDGPVTDEQSETVGSPERPTAEDTDDADETAEERGDSADESVGGDANDDESVRADVAGTPDDVDGTPDDGSETPDDGDEASATEVSGPEVSDPDAPVDDVESTATDAASDDPSADDEPAETEDGGDEQPGRAPSTAATPADDPSTESARAETPDRGRFRADATDGVAGGTTPVGDGSKDDQPTDHEPADHKPTDYESADHEPTDYEPVGDESTDRDETVERGADSDTTNPRDVTEVGPDATKPGATDATDSSATATEATEGDSIETDPTGPVEPSARTDDEPLETESDGEDDASDDETGEATATDDASAPTRYTLRQAADALADDWPDRDLDHTPQSLPRLDAFVDDQWEGRFRRDSLADRTVDHSDSGDPLTRVGAYYGEVLVRWLDGEWVATDDGEGAVAVSGVGEKEERVPVFAVARECLADRSTFAYRYDAVVNQLHVDATSVSDGQSNVYDGDRDALTSADVITQFASAAEQLVDDWPRYDLDYSPRSLRRLDEIVATTYADERFADVALADETDPRSLLLTARAVAVGAYFAVVLVRHRDGQWRIGDDVALVVDASTGTATVEPIATAAACLQGERSLTSAYESLTE